LPPVKKELLNIALWKKRVTLALLVLFCTLISSSEYLTKEVNPIQKLKTETSSENSDNPENQTVLSIAVNAVVPVANILSPQIFHFIFEIILPKKVSIGDVSQRIFTNDYFYKVLFERIISTNAP